ncbi:hypothetical protein [Acidiphilium sp.]|uniref:hypothetical protein n=1 Tax=Acidiphilium sp. TaxID=527 RepID=UPI003D01CD71
MPNVRKVWQQLGREGIGIAHYTTAQLMEEMGLAEVLRGKSMKTMISNPAAFYPRDQISRQFHAPSPNVLLLSDFTCVATWRGFVYVAFVTDVFVRLIVWLACVAIGANQLCARCLRTRPS